MCFMDFYETFFLDSFYSLKRVVIGTSAAILVGVLLGILRSCFPNKLKYNKAFKLVVDFLKFPPPIAWIPLVI